MLSTTLFICSGEEAPPKPEDLVKTSSRIFLSFNSESTVDINVLTHFVIAEGWHIYWKHSGDNGFPTTIKTDIKNTVSASDTKYSPPKVFIQDGLESYGYEKEAWILKTETVDLDKIPLKIKVDSNYFVCKNVCVLGNSSETIALEDTEKRFIASENESEFNKINQILSRLPENILGVGGFAGRFDGEYFEAEFADNIFFNNMNQDSPRCFPHPTPGVAYGEVELYKTKGHCLIKIPIEISPENFLGVSPTIRILIICETESLGLKGYWVIMPLEDI